MVNHAGLWIRRPRFESGRGYSYFYFHLFVWVYFRFVLPYAVRSPAQFGFFELWAYQGVAFKERADLVRTELANCMNQIAHTGVVPMALKK